MDTLKQEITRQLEKLSPEELQAVHQLITTFKRPPEQKQEGSAGQPPQSSAPAPEAVHRVRDALSGVSGSLSDVIAEEREERI